MMIKLNETMEYTNDITVDQLDPATKDVTIYWSEEGVEDKTFIFKQTFRKDADHEITGNWHATTQPEVVGWHAGGADNNTEQFIGNLGGHACSETDWPYSEEEFNKALTKEYYGADFIKIVEN